MMDKQAIIEEMKERHNKQYSKDMEVLLKKYPTIEIESKRLEKKTEKAFLNGKKYLERSKELLGENYDDKVYELFELLDEQLDIAKARFFEQHAEFAQEQNALISKYHKKAVIEMKKHGIEWN